MIRLLLADDQALVRGALSALLGLEPDLEVVAEVASGDAVVAGRARAPARRRPARRRDARAGRHRGHGRGARGVSPRCRVLIVTTFGRPGFLRRAMQAGADGFVVKDTPAAQLADAVRRVHAGPARRRPRAGHRQPVRRRVAAHRARDRGAARRPRTARPSPSIAAALFLSEGTVRNHLSAAIGKTGAANRAEAVTIAEGNGWL